MLLSYRKRVVSMKQKDEEGEEKKKDGGERLEREEELLLDAKIGIVASVVEENKGEL